MIHDEIWNYLVTHEIMIALVDDRIYENLLPEENQLPSVVYFEISAISEDTLSGPTGTGRTLLQFDCYTETSAEARRIRKAIKDLLQPFRGLMGSVFVNEINVQGQRNEFEINEEGDDRGRSIGQIDFLITHDE